MVLRCAGGHASKAAEFLGPVSSTDECRSNAGRGRMRECGLANAGQTKITHCKYI